VTTSTRWEGLPDIPTVGEFLPGFEVCAAIWWFTFLLVAVLLGIFVVVFGTKWILSPPKTTDDARPVITTTTGSGFTIPISRKIGG